jgi:hypothetical protein
VLIAKAFWVLIAVKNKITVFWDVKLHDVMDTNIPEQSAHPNSSTLKMGATDSSELQVAESP